MYNCPRCTFFYRFERDTCLRYNDSLFCEFDKITFTEIARFKRRANTGCAFIKKVLFDNWTFEAE